MDPSTARNSFRDLHRSGTFVVPNPFDRGSARLLAALGFEALATTSSGHAATAGRADMALGRDALVTHVADLVTATDLPLTVDAERGFADDPVGVAATVDLLAEAGAAGASIEDWDPVAGRIDDPTAAVERVAAAAETAAGHGLVLTARCENLIRGVADLDDTVARLVAYRDAGAEVVYAPGLVEPAEIRQVVEATQVPVNVLLRPGGPTVDELGAAGVRRVSLGGTLARVAYGAVVEAARRVQVAGRVDPGGPWLAPALAEAAFVGRDDSGS